MKFGKNIFLFRLALVLPLLAGCSNEKNISIDDPESFIKAGDAVPVFTVTGPDGASFSSSRFAGKRSLLAFFVTSCPDCQRELAVIDNVWNELKDDDDFMFVMISREESAETVTAYWKQKSYTMPYYIDGDRSVYSLFAGRTVPRIYLVDTGGHVSWMAVEVLPVNAVQLAGLMRGLP